MQSREFIKQIFSSNQSFDFEDMAMKVFNYQYKNVEVYQTFCNALNRPPKNVKRLEEIPFLPIQFFKSHKILAKALKAEEVFTSSGTTGSSASRHYVHSLKVYEDAFRLAFEDSYGPVNDFVVLALLPSYLERKGSSLIYMADAFIRESRHPESGFYLYEHEKLAEKLNLLDEKGEKVLLIGVSFALLDLIEKYSFQLKNTLVMETGGMKGRRKELTRQELHSILCKGFGVGKIHSEYGMTELLSQAYSKGDGIFKCPPTMSVLAREAEDPLSILENGKNGGLNIIDLANIHSCSFIATQDLGKIGIDGSFEVLGRFDNSDIRGCNLMIL